MSDAIETARLRDGDVEITVLSMGCAVQDWRVAGRPVVLGFKEAEAYRSNPPSFGVVCGRVVNRISNAAFELDGQTWTLPANIAPHHLHGGPRGLAWQNWTMARDGDSAVRLTYHSPHLEGGYPGAVDFEVTLRLRGHRLSYDMRALPDRPTPISLAQHIYFNLAGHGSIMDHALQIAADRYTPNGPDLLPTGEISDVGGTRWDFRTPRRLDDQPDAMQGWDGNLVLTPGHIGPQASAEAAGLRLSLTTDQRGVQLYTSNSLSPGAPALPGQAHAPFGGLCLEAQAFPNALNTEGFGSIIASPEAPYRQQTSIEIAPI